MIPPVVASERRNSPNRSCYGIGGCRTTSLHEDIGEELSGKKDHRNMTVAYCMLSKHSSILSSAEHEEFCVNLPGPSGKAKYSRETDSEPVP